MDDIKTLQFMYDLACAAYDNAINKETFARNETWNPFRSISLNVAMSNWYNAQYHRILAEETVHIALNTLKNAKYGVLDINNEENNSDDAEEEDANE